MDDLTGDDLKYVAYSVLYVERSHETTLQKERREVVDYDTTSDAFIRLKLAEFLSSLEMGLPIPDSWKDGNHPRADFRYIPDGARPATYSKIPRSALKYVSVSVGVIGRTPREEGG